MSTRPHTFGLLAGLAALCLSIVQAAPLAVQPGRVQPIEPHFIGYNQNFMGQTDPWRPALIEQLRAAAGATFRYPAGTVGSYHNWRTGRVDESLAPEDVMTWVRPFVRGGPRAGEGRYTLDNLQRATDATGMVPLLMLGMAVHDVDEQIAILKEAERKGLPIRYLELGNELVFENAEPLLERKFPDAETYGRIASEWIEKLRAAFPDAKIAACGTFVGSDSQSERRRTWNPRLLTTLRGTDILTTHLYAGEIVRTERELAGLTEVQAQQGLTAEERAARAATITPESIAATISLAYSVWDTLLNKSLVPPDKQLWVTEWSTGGVGGGGNEWQASLVTAALLDAFLRTNVTLTSHHTMGSVFNRTGGRTAENPVDQLNATGIILRPFSLATRGLTRATELRISDAPLIEVPSGRRYSSVVGWRFGDDREDGQRAVLLNLGRGTVDLDRHSLGVTARRLLQISGDPASSLSDLQRSEVVLAGDVLALPPYSVTFLLEDLQ